jgi:hypothetical protein
MHKQPVMTWEQERLHNEGRFYWELYVLAHLSMRMDWTTYLQRLAAMPAIPEDAV